MLVPTAEMRSANTSTGIESHRDKDIQTKVARTAPRAKFGNTYTLTAQRILA